MPLKKIAINQIKTGQEFGYRWSSTKTFKAIKLAGDEEKIIFQVIESNVVTMPVGTKQTYYDDGAFFQTPTKLESYKLKAKNGSEITCKISKK